MKFNWWLFSSRTAIVSRFYSLPECLLVIRLCEISYVGLSSSSWIVVCRGTVRRITLHFWWSVAEVTLELLLLLPTVLIVNGGWRSWLAAEAGSIATVHVLWAEDIISWGLRELLLSVCIDTLFRRSLTETSAKREVTLATWRRMDLYWSVTVTGTRVGSLAILLLLVATADLILSKTIRHSRVTHHSHASVHVLLWNLRIPRPCRVEFILLRNEPKHPWLVVLLFILCLVLIHLILILHGRLLTLFIATSCCLLRDVAKLATALRCCLCLRGSWLVSWLVFITPSQGELRVAAYFKWIRHNVAYQGHYES